MKTTTNKNRQRAKAIGIAAGAVVFGVLLIILSQWALASAKASAQSQPAPATSTAPASTTAPAGPGPRAPSTPPKVIATQRLAGLMLLFSLMSFGLAVVCVGWVIYDIRRSRPAWMTQTRYPVRRPKK